VEELGVFAIKTPIKGTTVMREILERGQLAEKEQATTFSSK